MGEPEEPGEPGEAIERAASPDPFVIPIVGMLMALSGVLSFSSLLFVDLSLYFEYGGRGVELAIWTIGAIVIVVPIGIGMWAMRAPDGLLVTAWTGAAAGFVPLAFSVYLTGGVSALMTRPEDHTPEIFILLFTAGGRRRWRPLPSSCWETGGATDCPRSARQVSGGG